MGRFFVEGTPYGISELREAVVPRPDSSAHIGSVEKDDTDDSAFRKESLDVLLKMQVGNKNILKELNGGKYQFQYVGVIAVGKYLFAVLPKYYTDDKNSRTLDDEIALKSGVFPTVMRTIAHFNASERARTL